MKERLDVLLVNNGLAETREKAKRTIMAGLVTVDGRLSAHFEHTIAITPDGPKILTLCE